MFYSTIKYLSITFAFIISTNVIAQKGTILDKKNANLLKEKIETLNGELGGKCVLEFEKKRLLIKFMEGGEPYRIDYVYLETLDATSPYFSEEENAVIVKCKKSEDLTGKLRKFSAGCIERHIIKNNIIRAYYRINFDVTGDKEKFIKTFKELIFGSENQVTPQ